MEKLLKALEAAGLGGVPNTEIEKYVYTDLDLDDGDLDGDMIQQIVDDLTASAAKAEKGSAIATQQHQNGSGVSAQPQDHPHSEPSHAFSGIAGQVGQQINDLVDVVEEECAGWEQGAAAHLHNRFASVPSNVLGYVSQYAEEARYDAATFRSQVRAGIGAFRNY